VIVDEHKLGAIAVARHGTVDAKIVTVGKIIAYSTGPMVLIQDRMGDKIWWRAELCDELNIPQDVADELMPNIVR